MTIETRGLIELKDIVAVEFECRKCGARLLLKLDGLDQVPTDCARCRETWVIHSSDGHARLHHFIQRIREFGAAKNEPYLMRFEVKGLAGS